MVIVEMITILCCNDIKSHLHIGSVVYNGSMYFFIPVNKKKGYQLFPPVIPLFVKLFPSLAGTRNGTVLYQCLTNHPRIVVSSKPLMIHTVHNHFEDRRHNSL